MPNPTAAKPTGNFAEWLSTASTVGELTRCFSQMPSNGSMRDVVGNVLAEPHMGPVNGVTAAASGGLGHPPAAVAGGFAPPGSGISDVSWKFGAGTTGLRFPARGWSTLAYPHTFWAVIKPVYGPGPVQRVIPLMGNGADTFFHGVALQVTTAGVITVGRYYGANTASTATLTSGKWYLVAMTHVSSTSCLFNVYCYDDQAYVTPSGTGTSLTVTAPAASNSDLLFNPYFNYDGYGNVAFIGEAHSLGVSDGTFDPAVNGYFAALVADPCAPARGTYTATGTLAAGGITSWDATTSAVTVQSNRPTLGAAGDQNRYQYRLHRSTTPSFTPGVGTQLGSLQSSPVLVDSTAAASTSYFYKVEQTDGASTVYSTTATANSTQASGRLTRGISSSA